MRKFSIGLYSAMLISNLASLLFIATEDITLKQKMLLAYLVAAVCGLLISLLVGVIEDKK